MLTKEQFDNIVKDLKEDVCKVWYKFEVYEDEFVVKINKQLYEDLLEFRKTLPVDYYGRLEIEKYDSKTDTHICTDGIFDCLMACDESYWNFFAITWIDGCMPVKIVDNVDYDYRIEFIYSKTKNYNAEKSRPKRSSRIGW